MQPKARTLALHQDAIIVCLLLASAVFILYWPAAGYDFVNYDDWEYFAQNLHVKAGLTGSGIVWSFTTTTAAIWHPLTMLSLMFDVSFFSSSDPSGPHFFNLVYHAANSVLLFLVLRRLTGAHGRSALVAGLFAVHPLNVESVAWISERKNMLSTLFWLLTLLAFARYIEERNRPNAAGQKTKFRPGCFYVLALVMFGCGLMSKPMLVTLPCVLLLLDFWPLNRWRMDSLPDWRERLPRLVWEKAPFFLLAAIVSVVTYLAQDKARQTVDLFPIGGRIENAWISYCRYLGKAVWPENLAVYYPHPGHWPMLAAGASAGLIVMASLAMWHWGRRWPFLSVGWFWFLGTLVPVIGIVQVGAQSMADRYAYVPLLGIFIIVSWGAASVFTHWRIPETIAATVAILLLTTSGLVARSQLACWKNTETLFKHAAAVTPNNCLANYNLGFYFAGKGQMLEAIKYYRAAIKISPALADAHKNLGIVLERTGQLNEAVKEYSEGIRLAPQDFSVHFDLGCVYVDLGNRDKAIEQFKEVMKLKPGFELAELRLQQLGVVTNQTNLPYAGK